VVVVVVVLEVEVVVVVLMVVVEVVVGEGGVVVEVRVIDSSGSSSSSGTSEPSEPHITLLFFLIAVRQDQFYCLFFHLQRENVYSRLSVALLQTRLNNARNIVLSLLPYVCPSLSVRH
jgi:hypothetical protein